MSLWAELPFILLGVLIALLPVGVIGLFASHLVQRQRTAILLLYAGVVLLLGIVAADVLELVSNRLAVDSALLIGGLAAGGFAGLSFPFRRPIPRTGTTKSP